MKKLDESKPFAIVTGISNHRYEQNGLRYNVHKECIDSLPKKIIKKEKTKETRKLTETKKYSKTIGKSNDKSV